MPSRRRMPPAASNGAQARKSIGSAPTQAWPLPRWRSRSSTAVSGNASVCAQARTPTRRRSPSTRRRRSIRGRVASTPSAGACTPRRPPITCSSPSRRNASSGSPPARDCGRPRTDQRPSAACCRSSARPRRRSSVSERPGNRPLYIDTSTSASPMAKPWPAPMRRPFNCSNGPRRVQVVSRRSKRTGCPARALSQAAILSGWRSASGSSWLRVPTSRASPTRPTAHAAMK